MQISRVAAILGIAFFGGFALWLVFFSHPGEASPVVRVSGTAESGMLMLAVGAGFIGSFLFQQSGFAKPFLFICQHFSWPASNKMALFYGFILSISGVAVILNDYSGSAG